MSERSKSSQGRVKRWILRSISLLGIVYVCILGMLIASETTLVYPGSPYPRGNWEPEFAFEEQMFPSADGTIIHAWLLPAISPDIGADLESNAAVETDADQSDEAEPVTPAPERYVLLCHGNGENIAQSSSWIGRNLQTSLNANVLVFDYHGFGKTKGKPSEKAVKEDAEAALAVLCRRFSIEPTDVILVGHSLGGGPAVHLAQTQGCKALILQRTFSSLPDVAQSIYWWLPVRYLMQNVFDSATAIKDYDGPLFQSHGTADTLIPIKFAKKLNGNCPSDNNVFYPIEGMGHFDGQPEAYWDALSEWLDEVE